MSIRLFALLSTSVLICCASAAAQEAGASFRMQMSSPILFVDSGTPDPEENNPTPAPLVLSADPAFPAFSQIGTFFSTTLSATGGTPPHAFEFSGGQPSDWAISGNVLSGTFSALGDLDFAVKVVGSESTLPFSSMVSDAAPLAFTTLPSTKYTPGNSVNATLAASGNDGPLTYSIASGTLPPGLSLSGSTISGSVGGTIGQTGTATLRVADSYSHVDHVLEWSLTAPAADTTVPVGARYRASSAWHTLTNHAALRDGNLNASVVTLTVPEGMHLALDLGSAVEGNSFTVAGTAAFDYRFIYSDNGTSFNAWGAQRTFSPTNGADVVIMPETRAHRYVGLQIVSPTSTAQITELRYGVDGVFP